MNAKKLGIGVGLAGAGIFAARSLGPRLHEHCRTRCACGRCGGAHEGAERHESDG